MLLKERSEKNSWSRHCVYVREKKREKLSVKMKYLKVEGAGRLEVEGRCHRGEEDRSSISDARCVLVFWSSSLRLDVLC